MRSLFILLVVTASFSSFAASCEDESMTRRQRAQCLTIQAALDEICLDHSSSAREIEQCKEERKDNCLDHSSSTKEIVECILGDFDH